MALLSRSINRQIGVFIDRAGKPRLVLAGDASSIYIPELPPLAAGRLRGWRFLHTHLTPDGLSREDLMDMLFLRMDSIAALSVSGSGEPVNWQAAWIMPRRPPESLLALPGIKTENSCAVGRRRAWHDCALDLAALAGDIESRISADNPAEGQNRAVLVSVSTEPLASQERNLDELADLAGSAGLAVGGRLAQRVTRPDPRLILGKGKLAELEVIALNANAEMLVFDGELTPAQLHNLADVTERKVIDRTQLILDIFAQRAATRAGKLQVELAQLAYAQPRLAGKRKALDRLMGGIGGRGPGESRLETDRRKSRERMARLRRELDRLMRQRALARKKREANKIPAVALVGYTNAGKSTLLNALSRSCVSAEDKLFATLDPVTRRLRFPEERELTISDTVGFIRNLPKELSGAFKATLEELNCADLLLHVADASHPELSRQIDAVETILEELDLAGTPRLLVLNKCDRLAPEDLAALAGARPNAIRISASQAAGLPELLRRLERALFAERASALTCSMDSVSN